MKKVILSLIGLPLLFSSLQYIHAGQGNFFVRGIKEVDGREEKSTAVLDSKIAKKVPLFKPLIEKEGSTTQGSSLSHTFKNSTQKDVDNFVLYVTMIASTVPNEVRQSEKDLNLAKIDCTDLGRLMVMVHEAYIPVDTIVKIISQPLINAWKGKIDHTQYEKEQLRLKELLDQKEDIVDMVWEETFPKITLEQKEVIEEDDCFCFEGGQKIEISPLQERSFFEKYKKYIYGAAGLIGLCFVGLLYKIMHKNA